MSNKPAPVLNSVTMPPAWFNVPLAVEPVPLAEPTKKEFTVTLALLEMFSVPTELPTSPTLKSALLVKLALPVRVSVPLSAPF